MSNETRQWIDAGKILAVDPTATVVCPRCGNADLVVHDVSASPTTIERHLRCPVCGAYNAILMKRPQEPKEHEP